MSKVIKFAEYGGPEVLFVDDVDPAKPEPGQVLIRTKAAPINGWDLKMRSGMLKDMVPADFPEVPGLDAAGVVEEVGEGATFEVGDEVCGLTIRGGYREEALLLETFAKPEGLSFEVAAALVTIGETAVRLLDALAVSEGDTVVIHGGAGAVGIVAAQLAAQAGATVIATANERDFDQLNELEITAVSYGDGWVERVREVAPDGVDKVIDTSGAGVLAESVELVGSPDQVITIADMAAQQHNVRFSSGAEGRAWDQVNDVLAKAAAGELVLPIAKTYPLEDAAQAQADLESGAVRGKVVLTV